MAITFDILLDGITITNRINKAEIEYSESNVHNSIAITSTDKDLFPLADPTILEGTSRIKVEVGTRIIYFLFESISGDEKEFTLWGRSLSAREENPYATDLEYELEGSTPVQTVVEEILEVSTFDWQVSDWNLPSSFEFTGSPMEGVQQIASAIGAVVRCKDDGTIYVRQKFPVRPIDMGASVVAVNYNRMHLIALSYEEGKGNGYNEIEVIGATSDVDLPILALDEDSSSPEQGEEVYVRAYWAGKKPTVTPTLYVTDGSVSFVKDDTDEETEVVIFENGVGSVSKPISSIKTITWIGDSGVNVSYENIYDTDLEIDDEAYRIAEIVYNTNYSLYRLSGHDVEQLIFLLTFGGESDVTVTVEMGGGGNPAPTLTQSLLTSQNIAVVAGAAWLDDNRYNWRKITIETPYNDNAIDGVLVFINDAEVQCFGKYHVTVCKIKFDGVRIVNELEVLQCQVS